MPRQRSASFTSDSERGSSSDSELLESLPSVSGQVTKGNLDKKAVYEIVPSIWDGCLFAGVDCLGTGASVMVVSLTIVCALTQIFFFQAVYLFMIDDPVSGEILNSLLEFRITAGHNIVLSDMTNRMSLASIVCMGEDSYANPVAGRQISFYKSLVEAATGGHQLVMLALFCWIMTIVGELDEIFQYVRAVANLPRGSKTRVTMVQGEELRAEVHSITAKRFWCLVCFVAVPRAFIALGLLYTGMQFLIFTLEPSELLMNAIALAFVLDIDNLIFAILAPRRVKSLVARVESLPVPDNQAKAYVNHTCGKVVLVLVLLLAAYFGSVSEVYGRVAQAQDILCSGNLNFVQSTNPASGVVQAGVTNKEPERDLQPSGRAALQTANPVLRSLSGWDVPPRYADALTSDVRETHMILGWEDMKRHMTAYRRNESLEAHVHANAELATLQPDSSVLKILQTLSVATVEEGAEMLDCQDVVHWASWTVAGLRHIDPNATSCEEVKHLCNKETVTRGVCPITCGCHDYPQPQAGFFASPAFGCPTTCQRGLHAVMVARQTTGMDVGCFNLPPAVFGASPYVQRYLTEGLRHLFKQVGTFVSLKATIHMMHTVFHIPPDRQNDVLWGFVNGTVVTDMLRGKYQLTEGVPHPRKLTGCEFWTSWEVSLLLTVDLCEVGGFRSLRAQCPQACACGPGMEECPLSCAETANQRIWRPWR